MKKFFIMITLCFMCSTSFGQASWDVIGNMLNGSTTHIIGEATYIGTQEIITKTITNTRYIYLDTVNGGYSYEHEFYKTHPFGYKYVREWSIMKQIPTDTLFRETTSIPTCIYKRYRMGDRLMVAGWINFGVGLGIAAIGGILLGAKDGQTTQQIKAGDALLGIGGTLITFSLPQLWFGDNIKREANVDYEIFSLQYKKTIK